MTILYGHQNKHMNLMGGGEKTDETGFDGITAKPPALDELFKIIKEEVIGLLGQVGRLWYAQ